MAKKRETQDRVPKMSRRRRSLFQSAEHFGKRTGNEAGELLTRNLRQNEQSGVCEDAVGLLTAISIVSRRLAENLKKLSAGKGATVNEKRK